MITCVIVAHPDDESIWFGEFLSVLARAKIKVLIIALTGKQDPVRSKEFARACKLLRCQGYMMDYGDAPDLRLPDIGKRLQNLLRRHQIRLPNISCMITHDPHGNENRHRQHRDCYHQVREWCQKKGVSFGFFSERPPRKIFLEKKTGCPIRSIMALRINRSRKKKLLDLYASQIHVLRSFKTYSSDFEYLYLSNRVLPWPRLRYLIRTR